MKKTFPILIALMGALMPAAAQVVGRVTDPQGEPLPLASVYFHQNPTAGTVTDNDGRFTIRLTHPGDLLTVSYLGYKEQNFYASQLTEGDTLRIVLQEQPILLDETVVKASAPNKLGKKLTAPLLERVYAQLCQDFPNDPVKYHFSSDLQVRSGGQIITRQQLIGYSVSLPGLRADGKDSVQLLPEMVKNYSNRQIREAFNEIYQDSIDLSLGADSSLVLYNLLWKLCNPKPQFKSAMKEPKKWTVHADEQDTVLINADKAGFLNIVRASTESRYFVGQEDRLNSINSEFNMSMNLPFGIKLDAKDLKFFNGLSLDGKMMEKLKLKRVRVKIRSNTDFTRTGNRSTVGGKTMRIHVVVGDKKLDNQLTFDILLNMNVIDVQTRNVVPFTQAELDRPAPRQEIDI